MIKYASGSFGFQILFRLHGSAVFKALTPAAISDAIYLLLYFFSDVYGNDNQIFDHPYPMGALVAALTFLLAFRANFSYNRYWEAITAVVQMHSKWLDVGMELAAFHLQSEHYPKPPAFGEHPDLKSLERERERLKITTLEELEEQLLIEQQLERESHLKEMQKRQPWRTVISGSFVRKRRRGSKAKSQGNKKNKTGGEESKDNKAESTQIVTKESYASILRKNIPPPAQLKLPPPRPLAKSINAVSYDPVARYRRQQQLGPRRQYFPFASKHPGRSTLPETKTTVKTVKSTNSSSLAVDGSGKKCQPQNAAWDPELPPLFLQETAHLLSLLSAVAFSTLRNDLEQADSPLIAFKPGAPWPHADPDAYGADVRKDWDSSTHRSCAVLRYILGFSRTAYSRTLYNAARPFRVIGGVSDAEIELLQAARGPLAKVALCTLWLQEFITREHLSGGTGRVGPPIISRLYQYTSDGMVGYNQARKVAYIVFPFPHAQITTLFVLIVVCLMPILMLAYLDNLAFGLVMNTLTVMCFSGLHEVARELESPFINAPNDIPCNYFQAQFNEALMTIFTGYHPDAYWEVCETVAEPSEKSDEVDIDDDEALVREVSKSSEPPKLPPPLPANQSETSDKAVTEQKS